MKSASEPDIFHKDGQDRDLAENKPKSATVGGLFFQMSSLYQGLN